MDQSFSRAALAARVWQRQEDLLTVFWDRRLSPRITRLFVRAGITPNQATLLWGAISIANSYTVYRAMTGEYWLVPVVWAMYMVCSVIDCVDGEVARATDRVNPVAGKLLDGVCHRATEYSLVGAFGVAGWTLTGSEWMLPITVLLLTGDAMQSYVYERRVTILRVQQRLTGALQHGPRDVYSWGTAWRSLTPRQKLATLTGTFHYKSVYPVIAVAYVSPLILAIGLALLSLYKHGVWVRLLTRTVAQTEPAEIATTGVAS